MEIDTDTNPKIDELDDHPTFQQFTKNEKRLYWSALKASFEVAEVVKEYQEQHGEVDLEDPVIKKNSEKLQTATALGEMLEEVAAWRRNGIIADGSNERLSLGKEFDSVDSPMEEENDE